MNLLSSNNKFIQLATPKTMRWPEGLQKIYPIFALIFAFVAVFISQIFGALPLGILAGLTGNLADLEATLQTPPFFLALLICAFLPLFFLVWGWVWLFEGRGLGSIGMPLRRLPQQYGRGWLLGLLLFTIPVVVLLILGFAGQEGAAFGVIWVVLFVIGWMVQGAAEEVLTRGFLLQIIGREYGVVAGIVLNSAVFAVLHLLNPNVSAIAMLNLFLFGVFTSLYVLREGSLWGAFAIHSVWNWAQGNLFGFEVSGQAVTATLLDLMETGPDWITGGLFGPEGGLMITITLIVACVAVVRWPEAQHAAI